MEATYGWCTLNENVGGCDVKDIPQVIYSFHAQAQ